MKCVTHGVSISWTYEYFDRAPGRLYGCYMGGYMRKGCSFRIATWGGGFPDVGVNTKARCVDFGILLCECGQLVETPYADGFSF